MDDFDSFDSESFGRALLWLRHSRRLTQQQAAARIGMSRSHLSNYETGSRTPKQQALRNILRGLGANYADFQDALTMVCNRDFVTPGARFAPPRHSHAAEPTSEELAILGTMLAHPHLALATTLLLAVLARDPAGWQSDL